MTPIAKEARGWIADRLARYFRAVDALDLNDVVAVTRGVQLAFKESPAVDNAAAIESLYREAFRSKPQTAHLLGNLIVDVSSEDGSGASAATYEASYLRLDLARDPPELSVGWCSGSFEPTREQWIEHRVHASPHRRAP